MEERLIDFALGLKYEDLPAPALETVKQVVLTVAGTALAGSSAAGVSAALQLVRRRGGSAESTVLVYGDRVPAADAVLVNAVMARALDFCDAMAPGIHLGSSIVPVGLAAAQLAGGASGQAFLTALAAGMEVAARINACTRYDGFDPTGVCTPFASAIVAGRLIGLDREQLWDALGLAFNMSAGSFQSNVEGTLAVRFIQGFAAQAGIQSVELARLGVTGPRRFLTGHYGFFHLFRGNPGDGEGILNGLGSRFGLTETLFKRHPSCGGTLTALDAALELIRETGVCAAEIDEIRVRVTPYIFRLVGHPFTLGKNPTVDAQFSMQYCVASAFVRKGTSLAHFTPEQITDPAVQALLARVHVAPDPELERLGADGLLTAIMDVKTVRGATLHRRVDLPRGHPRQPLTVSEHHERFRDCLAFSGLPLADRGERIASAIAGLEADPDVRSLVSALVIPG